MTDTAFRARFELLRRMTDRRLAAMPIPGAATDLDDGCRYILEGGGKRVRATLVMLSCEAGGGTARQALDAGAALEIIHNFTLVHDDIMDQAPSRRGRPTVHMRWNLNTALLVGDVLLGIAYRALLRTGVRRIKPLVDVFTRGVVDVCEGQALDLEFERRMDVSVAEYFRMIEKKTARMFAMAAELGGMIGGAPPRRRAALRTFGLELGRAFQLQDDLLDVTADTKRFGKEIGGDILARKKTYLLLRALERVQGEDERRLKELLVDPPRPLQTPPGDRGQSVALVTDIYRRYGIIEETRRLVERTTGRARQALSLLPKSRGTAMLHGLAEALVRRAF